MRKIDPQYKILHFDLDNTLCTIEKNKLGFKDYSKAKPMKDRIAFVNSLYDEGRIIKIDTARGSETGIDWKEMTQKQLKKWGLKYHVLRVGIKMHANLFIDDKGIHSDDFFN